MKQLGKNHSKIVLFLSISLIFCFQIAIKANSDVFSVINQGKIVAPAGDVDGDKITDIIITGNTGTKVISGATSGVDADSDGNFDGSEIFSLNVPGHPEITAITGTDLNGDGHSDLILGAGKSNTLFIFNGATGQLANTVVSAGNTLFGFSLAVTKTNHLIVGDPEAQRATVFKFDNFFSASVVQNINNHDEANSQFGFSLAVGEDYDGDQIEEIIVGAPGANKVFVYPGDPDHSISPLYTYESEFDIDTDFGFSIASSGDNNGDGIADVLVGAPSSQFTMRGSATNLSGEFIKSTIEGSSPQTEEVLQRVEGRALARLGTSVAGCGDQDGNGHDDFLVGAPEETNGFPGAQKLPGRVFVFKGGETKLENPKEQPSNSAFFELTLCLITGISEGLFASDNCLGTSVARIENPNNPSLNADFAVAAPSASVNETIIFTNRSLLVDKVNVSVSNIETQTLTLRAGKEFAGLSYFVVGSTSGIAPGTIIDDLLVPINFDPYTSITINDANTGALNNFFGVLDDEGNATATFLSGAAEASELIGKSVHHAFVVLGVEGDVVFASNALPLNVQP